MLAFDTETTGLLKPDACELHLQPSITEIYIAKFDKDFDIVDEFKSFVNPGVPLPAMITKITGITDEMLADAPSFVDIYDDLSDFVLGEDKIFAHNCAFDIGMLKNELKRISKEFNFPWPKNQVCTVVESFPIKNRRLKLVQLHEIATGKKEIVGAHRAKTDVMAMIECIKWLKNEGFIKW